MEIIKLERELEELFCRRDQQKKDGRNDYNLLSAVLPLHDEVRLHSRFLFSLLDTSGVHYQNELFLKSFLEMLNIKNFEFTKPKVEKEHEHIDLYITDGNIHIIIENKIYAKDQSTQIYRYINVIKDEQENEIDPNKLFVVYLSIDRNEPSSYSLNGLKVKNGKLVSEDLAKDIAVYKTLRYKDASNHCVFAWLEQVKKELIHIPNLFDSVETYQDIIQRLYGTNDNGLLNFEKHFFLKSYDHYQFTQAYRKTGKYPAEEVALKASIESFRYKIYFDFIKRLFKPIDDFLDTKELKLFKFKFVDSGKMIVAYLSWKQIGDIWVILNKDFSLRSVGVGVAWDNGTGFPDIKKQLENFNDRLKNSVLKEKGYVIGTKKGVPFSKSWASLIQDEEIIYNVFCNEDYELPKNEEYKDLKKELIFITEKLESIEFA